MQHNALKHHCIRWCRLFIFVIKNLQLSHRNCTNTAGQQITWRKQKVHERGKVHKQMYSQNSRLLQFVTRSLCPSLPDSPCKAELSSINKKQAGKKLLGETHSDTQWHKHTTMCCLSSLCVSVCFGRPAQVSICHPVTKTATTDPTSVTAAADSVGVWIAMATRWPGHAPTVQQIAVGRTPKACVRWGA